MVLLPFSVKLLAAYYPLVPSLSIQMETALIDLEVSAASLNTITTLAACLAGAWTKASSCKLSGAQGREQQPCSSTTSSLGCAFSSLPTSHPEPSSGMHAHLAEVESKQPFQPSICKAQLDTGKPQLQLDMGTASNSLQSGSELNRGSGPDRSGSGNDAAGLARGLVSMPLQQLQGLHRLLAGAAGASDIVSIVDDLRSGMFSMAPSHQLLPGAIASLPFY